MHLGHTEKKVTEIARFERQEARKRRRTETISEEDEATLDTPCKAYKTLTKKKNLVRALKYFLQQGRG